MSARQPVAPPVPDGVATHFPEQGEPQDPDHDDSEEQEARCRVMFDGPAHRPSKAGDATRVSKGALG